MDLASHPTPVPRGIVGGARGLVASAHPGPAAAVTLIAGVLTLPEQASAGRATLVVAAVLAGQLSIGWSNDLVDLARDRQVGRRDKPLAVGAVQPAAVRIACVVAVLACIPLSLACGWAAGTVHLGCLVGGGWAYNLGLKSTVWSWLPYAVGFGALPVFVALGTGGTPLWWVAVAGSLLGIGAHLVNTLPDLDDDRATGVVGLPHRMGGRATRIGAVVVLLAATLLLIWQADDLSAAIRWSALLVPGALSAVALRGRGRAPFVAVVLLAVVDVVVLAVAR